MASDRMTSSDMVGAMGAGIRLLDLLRKEVEAQKGPEEVLYLLTLPRFEAQLKTVARAIVECDFRIPASEMRKWAIRECGCVVEESDKEMVRNLWWYGPCNKFRIPKTRYHDDCNSGEPAIPDRLRQRLHGKAMTYPLFVDEKYVVVDIGFKEDPRWGDGYPCPKLGEVIDGETITYISVAERRHFDFDK